MGLNRGRFFAFSILIMPLMACLICIASEARVRAQAAHDPDYQTKREKADHLFAEGKRLEALPLLEELVKENPKDDVMLVDLAASLLDHAATLRDEQAARKERLRARQLLDRAYDLGDTSPLALNLSELLRQMPASGEIEFSSNPQVEQLMQAGEAAFSQRSFDEAIISYSKALEIEPTNYSAVLFIGNSYDKKGDSSKAGQWYDRAIQLEPDVETAYRYYADMAARHGNMAKARKLLIEAAVAEPYNRIVWREMRAWATIQGAQISLVYVSVPLPPAPLGQKDSADTIGALGPVARGDSSGANPKSLTLPSSVWEPYWEVRAKWKDGGEFERHFPAEKEYRHSLPEEDEALAAAAQQTKKLDPNERQKLVANDAAVALLLRLYEAGLIEPYVLFSLGDQGIARDYSAYRRKNRERLEEYLDRFVLPAAH